MASAPVQIGQVVDNKFRIERVLAQGGMGVLVAATHLHLEQRIAVKFRLAGAKADATRFMREARLAVRLQNRHVCRVMDLGFLDEETPYIVMEFLDGNDLAVEVDRRGPLPIDEAVEYLLQACDAMAEAHALGIVHRDIKPENLFLARQHDGRSIVKVLDFGISKQHGVTLTNESDLMGTPAYMAHEQWASAKLVTASADIYALGATLHFLLAGEPPYQASTIPEMFAKISTTTPTPLRVLRREIPADLEALVLSCLARTTKQRPADVLAVSDALLPFAPARKQAALSVVGRAFGRPSTPASALPSGSDARATEPMPAPAVTIPPSPVLSTNDLAVSVRSSSDEVVPRNRSRSIAIIVGGVAVVAIVLILIATQRSREETAPKSSAPARFDAAAESDAAAPIAIADAAVAIDVAMPVVDTITVDAAVAKVKDAGVRPIVKVDAAVKAVPPDATECPPGDYRCARRNQ